MSMSEKQLRVEVNGVGVGSLSMKKYQEMRSRVRRDPRTYVKALIVVMGALTRTLRGALAALPTAVFGLVLLAALLEPEAVTRALFALQSASPAEITAGLTKIIEVARYLLAPMIGLFTLISAFREVRDAYYEDVCREVRIALNASAVGHVCISMCEVEAKAPQSA